MQQDLVFLLPRKLKVVALQQKCTVLCKYISRHIVPDRGEICQDI